jgi:hypothetical protein
MTRKLFCLLAIPLLLAGCKSPVPANSISIKSPRGNYLVNTPKNVSIKGFTATIDAQGTFSLNFDQWTSTNDPQVVDKAYLGQSMLAREYFNGISGIAEKLAAGAAKGASPLP